MLAMAETVVGEDFVKHELNEAIAIQAAIIEAERELSKAHPIKETQDAIRGVMREDERLLKDLRDLGKPFGATGEVEEIAAELSGLLQETVKKATGGSESDAYEAHAVLLTAKRKQQDAAGSILKMGRAMKRNELRDAAAVMQKIQKDSSEELAKRLTDLAVQIATRERAAAGRR
jgi:hypothetical protein